MQEKGWQLNEVNEDVPRLLLGWMHNVTSTGPFPKQAMMLSSGGILSEIREKENST